MITITKAIVIVALLVIDRKMNLKLNWVSWHVAVTACCICFVFWSCARYLSERSFVGVIEECAIVDDSRGGHFYDTKSYFAVIGKVSYLSHGATQKVTYRYPIEPSFQCSRFVGNKVTIFVSELSSGNGRLFGQSYDWFTPSVALLLGAVSAFLRMKRVASR
jgi:hypothetical protein